MIRKKLLTGILFLTTVFAFAQQDNLDGAQITMPSQAIQTSNASSPNYTIQTGVTILGQNRNASPTANQVKPIDLRFPWGVLYLFNTFEENSFEVSKGFFGDKILLNWELTNNFESVQSFRILRREYSATGDNEFKFVANVSPSATSYEDLYVDGGILYEYKLIAEGITEGEALFTNFIMGLGFRNPTATVTGNVSFEGGNPVKDVIVKATSTGSDFNFGSSLMVPANGELKIEDLNKPISNQLTFQAWVKPKTEFAGDQGPSIQLFELSNSDGDLINARINYLETSDALHVEVGNSSFEISHYIPSGEVNVRGDDILIPLSNFNSQFTHFSFRLEDQKRPELFINGRSITEEYQTSTNETLIGTDASYTEPYLEITQNTSLANLDANTNWNDLAIGGERDAYIDEIRVYNNVLSSEAIRTDFSRYISGNGSSIVVYLRANEGVGDFAYDLSRNGFNYNGNNARLRNPGKEDVLWANGEDEIPNENQLGILGITNENGNYEISAIPYTGNGESFTITPVFGQHEFDPGQQLVFLGKGSEVANQINFTDISSFNFNGKVLYDTQGVFPSFVELNNNSLNNLTDGDEYVSGPGIIDEGYNTYEKSGIKYPKGEYWYNEDKDRLERYARIGLEGANVYIDGDIVLDENNMPVETDAEGDFSISVPIGNHFISVRKNGHELIAEGRFPAASGSTFEFFENSVEPVYFIDQTRVSVVGRVVGGAVEAEKPIGFGENGIASELVTNEDGITETLRYSSKNNIGTATLEFGHQPASGSITNATRFIFNTNEESGEYRVEVMPLQYQVSQTSGIQINSNSSINILEANETLNYQTIPEITIPTFNLDDDTIIEGEPFNYERSFIYRTTPVLQVIEQESENAITIDDEMISTDGFQHPVLKQFKNYEIQLKNFERYTNQDSGEPVEDLVPVIDGDLLITNNLATPGSESLSRNEADPSLVVYSYKAGQPNISSPFTRSIDIRYTLNSNTVEAENYIKDAIILGGESDGSLTQVTEAPDVPDIILRDPPGSSSSATIEAGTSISITRESQGLTSVGAFADVTVSLGFKFAIGGGVAGPINEVKPVVNTELGVSAENTSETGESITKTYTFNQSISTSDDPNFVGAEGDLYIGNSVNYSYGSYNNIETVEEASNEEPSLTLTNSDGKAVTIAVRKAFYFLEEPTETFFVYSQKFIVDNLIPQLEDLIVGIENGSVNPNEPGVKTKEEYQEQIYLWRKTILENEKSKYEVLNSPEEAQAIAINTAREQEFGDAVIEQIENNFERNITFDSGVGEITRTLETNIVTERFETKTVTLETSVAQELGLLINSAGVVVKTGATFTTSASETETEGESKTTTISYTLKDNSVDNSLSVNVYNLFDGYGPIFSTLGGSTSCPYEGPEESLFFQASTYNPENTIIEPLPEGTGEQLSFGTQPVERIDMSVERTPMVNIPEDTNAEFVLLLENTSATETNGEFLLTVDNTTNPNNAITNLGDNGRIVSIPFGEQVPFALTIGKSISDVYDYEDISITLSSLCDENITSTVSVSAFFVPSCTKVAVKSPLNNFSYNRDEAFNLDGSTNALNVNLGDYNTDFDSFQRIDLEYRSVGSPTWNRLQTYYATQEFYDEALINNETDIELITDAEINYNFDIVDRNLGDGEYEIRARSTCTNGTEFISDPISGTVDLNSPQRFGTPLPSNGIYASGTDLRARFSENIFYNSAVSLIEIKGQTNQLPINNQVSLLFAGSNNTMRIENPRIANGDLSIEFWLNNQTLSAAATLINQTNGIEVKLEGNEMVFNLAGGSAKGLISNDGLFHHYTLTYNSNKGELSIFEEDKIVNTASANSDAVLQNNNTIRIGGNTFIGNLSQLRFWDKTLTLEEAFANMYTKLMGNEPNLIAYYPLDEGRGNVAKDLARFKDAVVNTGWDIKPKGNSYSFNTGGALTLDNVGFAQLTPQMDATISFWIKTDVSQEATIFSNGKGDGTDPEMPNGFANKWSIDLALDGRLYLNSEGTALDLTENTIVDNQWHHVSIRLNRRGTLNTYLDHNLVSTNPVGVIGGFSGNTAFLGARGSFQSDGSLTLERHFEGNMDEFRLWNTLRNNEQEERDAYEEIDPESLGLMIYSRLNEPEFPTGNGPRYYHAFSNNSTISTNAILEAATTSYSQDTPPIKPARELISIPVNHIINGDEIILEPLVNSFAEIEGQILDVTVHRLFDAADNQQQSPVTWSVFVQKNDVDWFADGFTNDVIDIVKNAEEPQFFELTLVNRGGTNQPFTITNIPSWLRLSETSGILSPGNQVVIKAEIEPLLESGVYSQDLRLSTNFGLDQVQLLNLRVLDEIPDWNVNPSDFEYNMNIIGILNIDGIISEDPYDRIAAFSNGELRAVSVLEYNENYDQYYAFLSIYSNQTSGEDITFKAWNATTGDIQQLELDGNPELRFLADRVIGSLVTPAVFSDTNIIENEIDLHAGWNWISLNVEDPNFSDLNALTSHMNLETSDRILSHMPAQLETYFLNGNGSGSWSGSISANGGISSERMYKVRLQNPQQLKLIGPKVDVNDFKFEIKENWNWLPYPLSQNVQLPQALANYNPTEGDVIKSQNLFAIYDNRNGWVGTLRFLQEGKGYMIKSTTEQEFTYPASIAKTSTKINLEKGAEQQSIDERFIDYPENMNAVVKLPKPYKQLYIYNEGGEIKGVGENQKVGNQELTFITIYGDISEKLYYFAAAENLDLRKADNLLEFKSNAVLGNLDDPVVLKFGNEEHTSSQPFVSVFPNPFQGELSVEINLDTSKPIHVEIYSMTGQVILSKDIQLYDGDTSFKINLDIADGTYFLKVSDASTTLIEKIIKN